jgi:NADPH2:quinone reductase
VLHIFGPPSVLVVENVADPVPGPGHVSIDVQFAGITFVETQIRAGKPPNPAMLPTLPTILGNGVGGTVVDTGEGADTTWLGKRVISSLSGTGGYAERAVADAAGLIEIPAQLSTQAAAALLADGRTAMLVATAAQVQAGETVLVEAAAGGVGSLLVQLARSAGARVIAAAGGERKLAIARELGADVTVDYSDPSWTGRLAGGVDVVIDGVGGEIGRAAFGVLRQGGRFCALGMASGAFAPVDESQAEARGITLIGGMRPSVDEQRGLVHAALDEAVASRLRPLIGQTFELERAAEAHAAIEQRATVGKTLLVVSGH